MEKRYNKLESKIPGAKMFLWWIEKANEIFILKGPPCYYVRQKSYTSRWLKFKARIVHLISCRKFPWTILPHKPGEMVEDSVLEPYYGKKALLKQYEKAFGQPYGQPIKQTS